MRVRRDKASWRADALICLAVSALLILLCSMSSPLYPINIWDDANCLLTVGRVMKAGGVLYRDIYEQKGPLLYLIHMLAAMISQTSFLGVYCMEVIAFAFTLYAAKKTAQLWTGEGGAWACTLLFGAAVVVGRSFARGDSAEEFCLPLLMAGLYIALSCAQRAKGPLSARVMFLLGLMAGGAAAIKYTALGLFLGLCITQGMAQLLRRDVRGVAVSAGAFAAGMALPILPWIAYFAAHGALEDAYTAYIHNNIFLYDAAPRALAQSAVELLRAGWDNLFWALPAVAGVIAFVLDREKPAFARACVGIGALMAGAAVFLPGKMYAYYPLMLSVFAPVGLGYAAAWLSGKVSARALLAVSGAAALAAAILLSPNAFLRGVPLSETAQGKLAARMEAGASLLQYSHLDDGLYLTHGVLPEEKYFVLLNVEFEEMRAALDGALREGRPEYVLISWRELPEEFDKYTLIATEIGYDDENRANKEMRLYRRNDE